MEDTIVSQPFSVQHNIHVDFDSDSGFKVRKIRIKNFYNFLNIKFKKTKGLPPEWESLLNSGGITKEEVLAKPTEVLKCLEIQSNFLNEKPQPIPKSEAPDDVVCSLSKFNSLKKKNYFLIFLGKNKGEIINHKDPTDLYGDIHKIGEGYF